MAYFFCYYFDLVNKSESLKNELAIIHLILLHYVVNVKLMSLCVILGWLVGWVVEEDLEFCLGNF